MQSHEPSSASLWLGEPVQSRKVRAPSRRLSPALAVAELPAPRGREDPSSQKLCAQRQPNSGSARLGTPRRGRVPELHFC